MGEETIVEPMSTESIEFQRVVYMRRVADLERMMQLRNSDIGRNNKTIKNLQLTNKMIIKENQALIKEKQIWVNEKQTIIERELKETIQEIEEKNNKEIKDLQLTNKMIIEENEALIKEKQTWAEEKQAIVKRELKQKTQEIEEKNQYELQRLAQKFQRKLEIILGEKCNLADLLENDNDEYFPCSSEFSEMNSGKLLAQELAQTDQSSKTSTNKMTKWVNDQFNNSSLKSMMMRKGEHIYGLISKVVMPISDPHEKEILSLHRELIKMEIQRDTAIRAMLAKGQEIKKIKSDILGEKTGATVDNYKKIMTEFQRIIAEKNQKLSEENKNVNTLGGEKNKIKNEMKYGIKEIVNENNSEFLNRIKSLESTLDQQTKWINDYLNINAKMISQVWTNNQNIMEENKKYIDILDALIQETNKEYLKKENDWNLKQINYESEIDNLKLRVRDVEDLESML